ncbi:lanC-like protein 3 homolog isoform X2 [Contarinia nasturtii]|uniref:lanC-like protein 3 homolog isoform X2 n=1 Tax=Contarinia nasturtii TaxID=265458 RepID=UPI0012D473D4|nr:lanC-like protein 3 homolog isoform X2 [Contarinia nasturtii]
MEQRYFNNPYEEFKGQPVEVDETYVRNLIKTYVQQIVENTQGGDSRGDLYVGDAGIAFMFLRLCQTNELVQETSARENAQLYINRAKRNAKQYSRSRDERCAFLCGNAGIYAVSAAISELTQKPDTLQQDLKDFEQGFEACKPVNYSKHGGDELLVGRAGFLSGVYWLNQTLKPKPFSSEAIVELCESVVKSGRQYSKERRSTFPLMYQYHGTEYLGAAHGLSGILHMLLESPWFSIDSSGAIPIPKDYEADIKDTIDAFLALQDSEGNFPCDMEDAYHGNANSLLHWCHGAPGAIYLLIKAYLIFKEEKYLVASERAADLIWQRGLLFKGPGICHGVAGNGYASLIMYRLTNNPKYLYRATKFAKFLSQHEFVRHARRPDCPWSLYEGLAGTVCYLIDLLHPATAAFPFMNVF